MLVAISLAVILAINSLRGKQHILTTSSSSLYLQSNQGMEESREGGENLLESVRSVVFREPENLGGGCFSTKIEGYDFNRGVNSAEIFKSHISTGFQASILGYAIQLVNHMVSFIFSETLVYKIQNNKRSLIKSSQILIYKIKSRNLQAKK